MSTAGAAGIGLLVAALTGIIVMEWRAGERWNEPAPHAISLLPSGEQSREVAVVATDHGAEWIDTMLARPLFTPGRKPPRQPHVETTRKATEDLPRLAGVLVSPAGKAAIFAPGGAKPIVVYEGGKLGKYVVQTIGPDRVTLHGPGATVVLQPTFENQAKPAIPAAPVHRGPATGWGGAGVRNDSAP